MGPEQTDIGVAFKKGPPARCNAFTPLSITFNVGSVALQSDNGAYEEDVENVGAHLNDPTGRLMLWTSQYGDPTRAVLVTTTAFNGSTTDRIFTNGHDNPGGNSACGFAGIVVGSPGNTAVLEAELNSGGIDNGIVRYGKDCGGVANENDPNRVVTTRSGSSWTITGVSGVHCKNVSGNKGKKGGLEEVGDAGPFSMTLTELL